MSCGRTRGVVALAPLLFLAMAACEITTDNEFATLTVQLTDAPSEQVTEAWVTITDVYLQPSPDGNGAEGARVYVLEDADEAYELLSLANDVAFLAVGIDIPAGTYEQLRLVISDGCIVVESGAGATVYSSSDTYLECGTPDGTLQMPSYGQSGAKVPLNGLELTGNQGILLDFNVPESFGHQAGNSGKWVLHPVIDWAEVDLTAGIDVTLSAGDLTLPLEGNYGLDDFSVTFSPTTGESETVDFTDDGSGVFKVSFRHLVPANGPFEIQLIAPLDLIITVTSGKSPPEETVSPGSGEIATVEFVLESAVLGGGS